MNLWPHQIKAIEELPKRMAPGRSICCASPTGSGKSKIMAALLERAQSAVLYTNRKMLLEQTSGVLEAHGIRHGIRAAGHPAQLDLPIQLASIQTTASRSLRKTDWPLHEAELVLIDEAHLNKEATAAEIIRLHHEQGAAMVGFTATPLNVGHIYDDLYVAATVSDCRACGALVPAYHFAPDEPDMRKLRRKPNGEYTTREIVGVMMTHCIIGRVVKHWRAMNPEQKPSILFAPGVKESIWFAEELCKNGIPAAHIDGEQVWIDGQLYESDRKARKELEQRSRAGEIKIVCNRFVMREGIDWPWLECGIFATIFGALTSYLQSGGRLLRACPDTGKTGAIILDHGGNWYRHGSLNSDREWSLELSDYIVGEMREESFRKQKHEKEFEPICCPKCTAVRSKGKICPNCGFHHEISSRMVVQKDGSLKEMKGDIYKPRRVDRSSMEEIERRWKSCYFRAQKRGMTFNQARGLYQYENNWASPPDGLPFMPPAGSLDWFRQVSEVPAERLHSAMREVAA